MNGIPLAGPIEFGPEEIALLLLGAFFFIIALPSLGGVIALLIYRRRVPPEERSTSKAIGVFAIGFSAAYALYWLFSVVDSLFCLGGGLC